MNTKLRTAREQYYETMEAFAKHVGIPARTYRRYESGERVPDVITGCKIARALGIREPDKLFRRKNTTNPG